MHAKSLQSGPTLWNPVDHSPPGSSVHGVLQARILEWVTVSSSGVSSGRTYFSCISIIAGRFFTTEPPGKTIMLYTWYLLQNSICIKHVVVSVSNIKIIKEKWNHKKKISDDFKFDIYREKRYTEINIQQNAQVSVELDECSCNQFQIKQNLPSTSEDPPVSPNSGFHIYSKLMRKKPAITSLLQNLVA